MRQTSVYDKKGTPMSRKEYVAGIRVVGHNSVYWFRDRMRSSGRLEIGRTRQRDIRIPCRSVSRRHCAIERVEPGLYVMRDLDSSNGLEVAVRGSYGPWVAKSVITLEPGIHIRLGRQIVVPVDADGACPITVKDHVELARMAESIYGSASQAAEHVGRSRQWIRKAITNLERMLL